MPPFERVFSCKVFSNEALFCVKDRICRRLTDLPNANVLPLSAVILLNSPAAGGWEWSEYKRLYSLYRGERTKTDFHQPVFPSSEEMKDVLPCYFICADGAYSALQKGLVDNHPPSATHDANAQTEEELMLDRELERRGQWVPDVVIGDMDSCDPTDVPLEVSWDTKGDDGVASSQHDTCSASAVEGEGAAFYRFPSVDKIPEDVLRLIRARALAATTGAVASAAGSDVSAPSLPPLFLRIECQMTTDFQKVVSLLARLEKLFPLDFPRLTREPTFTREGERIEDGASCAEFVLDTDHSLKATALSKRCYEIQKELLETMDSRSAGAWDEGASKEDIQNERERVGSLLQKIHKVELSSTSGVKLPSSLQKNDISVRSHILPQIGVLGALGGRFDHEMAAMSCLLEYSQLFHIAITNKNNIISACWTDGLTAWFPYNVSTTQRSETSTQMRVGNSTLPFKCEKKDGCGVIPMGTVKEIETTGLLYNIVKGRPDRCDAITQTSGYRFAFGGLLSACNSVADSIVTIDLCPTGCSHSSVRAPPFNSVDDNNGAHPNDCTTQHDIVSKDDSYNPPTLICCSRT